LYSTLKTKVTRCCSPSQPNKYVFNARRNWWRVRSDCRKLDGRLFHNPWSSNWECLIAETSAGSRDNEQGKDQSWRAAATRSQSSTEHWGARPCNDL